MGMIITQKQQKQPKLHHNELWGDILRPLETKYKTEIYFQPPSKWKKCRPWLHAVLSIVLSIYTTLFAKAYMSTYED